MSLRKFIWSFTKLGDLRAAYSLLQHMVSTGVRGGDCLRVSGEKKIRSSRLDIPIPVINDFSHGVSNEKRVGLSSPEICRLDATKEASVWDDKCMSNLENETPHTVEGNAQISKATGSISHGIPGDITFAIFGKDSSHMHPFLSSSAVDETGHGHTVIDSLSAFGKEIMPEKCTRIDVKKNTLSTELKKVLRWSFNDLIHACAQCREYNMAEQLFLQVGLEVQGF